MGTIGLDTERGLFLGIDFGTTNSVVSVFDIAAGEARTIPIDGGNIFPSAVLFESDPENPGKLARVFGVQAKEAAVIYPEATVLSVKRLLGNTDEISLAVGGDYITLSPKQIAAEILGYIKQQADEYARDEMELSGEFTGCVITVPANSTDKQKKLTKEAAVLAGFDEDTVYMRLEPAAAAISYAVSETADKKILVYDFGGGTFDACILEIKGGKNEPSISILATYGDNNLGGDDIDKIIMDMVYEEFKALTDNEIDLFDDNADDGVSKRQKKTARSRLITAATQAKERLSHAKTTKVTLAPLIQEPRIVNITMEITQEEFYSHRRINALGDKDDVFAKFEGLSVRDLLNKTLECVDKSLQTAKLTERDINEIFLVGGSSGLPLSTEVIREKFGKDPFRAKISPALSISQGAAYYCNMIMTPTVKGPVVHEKTIHPLGLEIAGRVFMEIVPAGLDIPDSGLTIEAPEPLITNFDNLTSMAIIVYENTQPAGKPGFEIKTNAEGMKRLAGTSLRGIPAAPKGVEKVRVIFNVGQDNMLKVTAKSESAVGVVTELSVDDLYD